MSTKKNIAITPSQKPHGQKNRILETKLFWEEKNLKNVVEIQPKCSPSLLHVKW